MPTIIENEARNEAATPCHAVPLPSLAKCNATNAKGADYTRSRIQPNLRGLRGGPGAYIHATTWHRGETHAHTEGGSCIELGIYLGQELQLVGDQNTRLAAQGVPHAPLEDLLADLRVPQPHRAASHTSTTFDRSIASTRTHVQDLKTASGMVKAGAQRSNFCSEKINLKKCIFLGKNTVQCGAVRWNKALENSTEYLLTEARARMMG